MTFTSLTCVPLASPPLTWHACVRPITFSHLVINSLTEQRRRSVIFKDPLSVLLGGVSYAIYPPRTRFMLVFARLRLICFRKTPIGSECVCVCDGHSASLMSGVDELQIL